MAAKKKAKRPAKKAAPVEKDGVFFMKVVFFFLLGTMWLRLLNVGTNDATISLPIGLILGVLFAHHEHFTIDRKVEYVVLLVAATLSFYQPVGILF